MIVAVDHGAGVPDGELANWFPIFRLEGLICDTACLVSAMAELRGIDGLWLVTLNLQFDKAGHPASLTDFYRWGGRRGARDGGHTQQIPGSRSLDDLFETVDAELRSPATYEDIMAFARDMARSSVNQFGYEELRVLSSTENEARAKNELERSEACRQYSANL